MPIIAAGERLHSKRFQPPDSDFETDVLNNRYFMRPVAIAVPETGYHSRDMLDTEAKDVSTSYNNPPAGVLLSIMDNFVKEPSAAVYLHWHCAAAGNLPLDLEVRSRGKRTVAWC